MLELWESRPLRLKMLKHNKVHVFSTNFALYGDLSKIMILAIRSNKIEVYSIDEAFMSFQDVGGLEEKALMIKEKVAKNVGIPVSIGVYPPRLFVK